MLTTVYHNRLTLASYQEYKNFVQAALAKRLRRRKARKWVRKHITELLSIYSLNFEPIHEKLASLYSPNKAGKPPYDPQMVLRSLFLMSALHETSITDWSSEFAHDDIWMIFCGLAGSKAPSVGAYYDFLKRLENGPYQPQCRHCVRPSDVRKAQRRQKEKKEKPKDLAEIEQKNGTPVMQQFVEQLKASAGQPVPYDLERLLNEILRELGVKPSIDKGFMHQLEAWSLVGDGSIIKAHVSSFGKATCDCRKNGIYDCQHERIYADARANWGWDNRDKCLKFGYHYFQWVDHSDHHDFPCYLQMAPGNLYEPKMALSSLDRMLKEIEAWGVGTRIKEVALDAMHDLYATYRYLRGKGIDYAIPLRNKPAACIDLGNSGLLCNEDGKPLCPGNAPMTYVSADKNGRHIYQCPAKRCTHECGKMVRKFRADWCPRGADCQPESKLGPLVHVSCDIDPRLHPNIPRDSPRYTELYNKRSGCERSNSMKKYTHKLGSMRTRVMSYAFIRMALVSVLEHSRVWAAGKLKGVDLQSCDLLSLFT